MRRTRCRNHSLKPIPVLSEQVHPRGRRVKEDRTVMKVEVYHSIKETKSRAPTSSPAQAAAHAAGRAHQPVSSCDDLHMLIAKRAYELRSERGYRHGCALDDWLETEREIPSQIPLV